MAMKKPTIAIVSAGDMGSAVAERLSAHGARVLTDLSGRSQATKDRATACGMEHCSLDEVVRQSDWFLSIVPPKETENLAKAFVATVQDAASSTYVQQKDWRPPVFVDCNAKNPKTTLRLARLFSSVTTPSGSVQFLNASILGLPPKGDHNPTFYASAAPDPADQQILCNFEKLSIFGLRTKILCGEGSDICDASILKMTYSGIMKGMIAVYELMIISAHAHSPTITRALLLEMGHSLPTDLQLIEKYVPQSLPKAYRFIREMEEMSGFVHDCLGNDKATALQGSTNDSPFVPSQMFDGFAALYDKVAMSLKGVGGHYEDGSIDVDVLNAFVHDLLEVQRQNQDGT